MHIGIYTKLMENVDDDGDDVELGAANHVV